MRRKAFLLFIATLLAAALAGCGHAGLPQATPASTAVLSSAASYSATLAPAQTTPPNPTKQQALDAFREIAFTGEYGEKTDEIRKWTQPIRVLAQGNPAAGRPGSAAARDGRLKRRGGFSRHQPCKQLREHDRVVRAFQRDGQPFQPLTLPAIGDFSIRLERLWHQRAPRPPSPQTSPARRRATT